MLKLYREPQSPEADAIEGELKDILLGFDRVDMEPAEAQAKFGRVHSLPVLADNERVVSGKDALAAYLNELRKFMQDWQAFQGDSCYVDEDGESC
jgi:hypothetical protein